jgi:hypothetical protein
MSMAHTVKVRGRLSDPRHIELDEPVNTLTGPVDVVVQAAQPPARATASRSIIGLCADLRSAPTADEIDEARRETWAGVRREDV